MSDSEHSNDAEQMTLNETGTMGQIITETRNPWELLRAPLREQLKKSKNVLWSEAAKARYHAAKQGQLFQRVQMTSRMANLGSLTNIPKPNSDFNRRLSVVYGDLCTLNTDAYVVPQDDSELYARVQALAGEELLAALKRLAIPLGDCGMTEAFKLNRSGYPQHLLFCNVPKAEDPVVLKQAYDRAFYIADYEGVATVAVPVMAGIAYPKPGMDYYPLIGAIHVMLSSIRQTFEKAKAHQFTLVVIVVANERERSVVNDLMELYFPHDPENELADDLKEDVILELTEKKPTKSAKGKRSKSAKKK